MIRTLLFVLALGAAAGVGAAQPTPASEAVRGPAPVPAGGQAVSCPALLVVANGGGRFKSSEDPPRALGQSEVRPDGALICTYPLDLNGAAATLSFPGHCRASDDAGWSAPQGGSSFCKAVECHAICR